MIESKEICMSRKKMLSVLFMKYGQPWLWVAITGSLVFIFLGFLVDYRFFILGLIWIFLLLPMLTSFLYFYYGMLPLTTYNTIDHKLFFYDDHILIRFFKENTEKDDNKILREVTVPIKDSIKISTDTDCIIMQFKEPNKGWLWIPVNGFSSIEDFKTVISNGRF